MTMQDQANTTPTRVPWNKGKVTGAKPPLGPKHVCPIRTKLQIEGRARDLAMFNLAIDSKLRGCRRHPGRGRRCQRIRCGSRNGSTEENRPAGQIRVE